MTSSKAEELATRQTRGIWWAPSMNRLRDQTGIAHVVHGGALLCGAKPFDSGGSFATPQEAGCSPCKRCLKIIENAQEKRNAG